MAAALMHVCRVLGCQIHVCLILITAATARIDVKLKCRAKSPSKVICCVTVGHHVTSITSRAVSVKQKCERVYANVSLALDGKK